MFRVPLVRASQVKETLQDGRPLHQAFESPYRMLKTSRCAEPNTLV